MVVVKKRTAAPAGFERAIETSPASPLPMPTLKDKVALVTGASSGIGRAIAQALMSAQASVSLVGRNSTRLTGVAAGADGAHGTVIPVDLRREEAAEEIARRLERDFGRLNLLIHSAGTMTLDIMADASPEDFDQQFAVNLRAPYLLTKAVLPMLVRAKGDIVFVNSSVLRFPRADAAQYAATKGALLALADSIRADVNAEGVRVLSVFPGCTATPMQQRRYESEGRSQEYNPERLLQPEDIAATVLHAITLPRTAEITDIHIRPTRNLP